MVAAGSEHKTPMTAVWKVLVQMLKGQAASQAPSAMSLLKGARKYLESGYVDYVTDTIRGHRAQVGISGFSTSFVSAADAEHLPP